MLNRPSLGGIGNECLNIPSLTMTLETHRRPLRPSDLFHSAESDKGETIKNSTNSSRSHSRDHGVLNVNTHAKLSDLELLEKRLWNLNGLMTYNNQTFHFKMEDFCLLDTLGSGACSTVYRAQHRTRSQYVVAVKQMYRSSCQMEENRRIARDLEVVTQCHDCPYIVQCYGVLITGLEVWICMEIMDTCLDKLQKALNKPFPIKVIGTIAVSIIKALTYLKNKHQIMHRDLKPSNMLLSRHGEVKLCDFGISSRLQLSVAHSVQKGCAGYLAPERVESEICDVRADIWSLGLTLFQLGTCTFPYDGACCFETLSRITREPAPRLTPNSFALSLPVNFCQFVNACLTKNVNDRPKYPQLVQMEFYILHDVTPLHVKEWYDSVRPEIPTLSNGSVDLTATLSSNGMNGTNFAALSNDINLINLHPSPIYQRKLSKENSDHNNKGASSFSPIPPSMFHESTIHEENLSHRDASSSTTMSIECRSSRSQLTSPDSVMTFRDTSSGGSSDCPPPPVYYDGQGHASLERRSTSRAQIQACSYLPYQGSSSAPLPQCFKASNTATQTSAVRVSNSLTRATAFYPTGQTPLYSFYTSPRPRAFSGSRSQEQRCYGSAGTGPSNSPTLVSRAHQYAHLPATPISNRRTIANVNNSATNQSRQQRIRNASATRSPVESQL